MPKFNYVAMDSRGKETKGTLEVNTQNEAIGRLKEMGFFPTKVVEVDKTKEKAHDAKANVSRRRTVVEATDGCAPPPPSGGTLIVNASKDFDFTEEVRGLQVPTLIVAADADMAPPSHYAEVFSLLDGGLRDGGWMGEGRPKGGHALAILPGLTHYSIFSSPLFAAVTLAFLDDQPG